MVMVRRFISGSPRSRGGRLLRSLTDKRRESRPRYIAFHTNDGQERDPLLPVGPTAAGPSRHLEEERRPGPAAGLSAVLVVAERVVGVHRPADRREFRVAGVARRCAL